MMQQARRPVKSLTDGFALCTPGGKLLGHTYRQTSDQAVHALFPVNERSCERWAGAQSEGWTVEHVYARIFSPQFFADVPPEPLSNPTPSTAPPPFTKGLRRVAKHGVRVNGVYYNCLALRVGTTVFVRVYADEDGRAHIYSPDEAEYLGEALRTARSSGGRIDPHTVTVNGQPAVWDVQSGEWRPIGSSPTKTKGVA